MPVVPDTYRRSTKYALAYSALVLAAHSRSMITYAGIARLTGLPATGNPMAKEVGRLVGEISEDEVVDGRPMLSALVVEKDTGHPGKGFFSLARNLKKLVGMSASAEKAFLKKEKTKLFDLWQ